MAANKLEQIFKRQKEQKSPNKSGENDNIIQLVGFIVGTEEFAVPILSIQEIIKPIEFTRVPSTPKYVLGVFNLRGTVIPIIDLRAKFGLGASKQTEDTRYIVMKYKDDIAGFVIDKLTEAIRISESNIDPAPETINQDSSLIYGIGKQKDRILTILKVEGLLKRDF
ncbi:MAG: purine-binding chemotaxis protein CheW [Campylobacterales bacterium]|nr:purine-binding chemotaxis protein CheW [Campylobacterales bacterium]